MNSKVKKIISVCLTLFLLLGTVTVMPISASAAENVNAVSTGKSMKSGDFEYVISNYDYTVTITAYTGTAAELTIPSEINGIMVTDIDDGAFSFCTSLTNVIIPDSVTYIGAYAFNNCTNLKNVTIPAGVDFIYDYAFGYYEDDSYEEVKIDGFTITGYSGAQAEKYAKDNGFEFISLGQAPLDCIYKYEDLENNEIIITRYNGLEENLTIPSELDGKTVTTIQHRAFYDCTSLTNVIIPDSVTFIGGFYGCTNLTNITIPDSVAYIDAYAFYDCTSLSSVTIPDSVTHIYGDAFYGCKNLKNVTIPTSVDYIYDHAFGYFQDDSYNEIKIDGFTITGYSGVQAEKYAKDNGFEFISLGQAPLDCIYKYEDLENNEIRITRYNGLEENLTILSELDGKTVTCIGWEAFSYCTNLKNVVIPDSVIEIDMGAFFDCTNLENIVIPDSVIEIKNGVFSDCTNLKNIVIPNSVKYIGWGAFYDCTNLTNVMIPDTVTEIDSKAFYNCPNMKNVTIPADMDYIGDYAFGYYEDENYNEAKFEDFKITGFSGVQAEKYAKDNGFEFISLGQAPLNCIYKYDKYEDNEIKITKYNGFAENLTIPSEIDGKTVESIGDSAFSNCTTLTSITIPDSVTYIGWYAFNDCTSLTSVTFSDSVTGIGWFAFYNCTNLKSVTIPAGVNRIGNYAFGYYEDENYDEVRIDDFKITGYSGSEAEKYAKDNCFEFISLGEVPTTEPTTEPATTEPATEPTTEPTEPATVITDKDTNVSVEGDIPEGVELNVESAEAVVENAVAAYNITLEKDGKAVQPDGKVTVKLPVPEGVDGSQCKVYYVDGDSKTDMNAVFVDGYLVFETDHFSVYAVVKTEKTSVLLGDVNADGKVNIKDATTIQKSAASLVTLTEEQKKAADVNGDGKVNVNDATVIQKYTAGIDTGFKIGE